MRAGAPADAASPCGARSTSFDTTRLTSSIWVKSRRILPWLKSLIGLPSAIDLVNRKISLSGWAPGAVNGKKTQAGGGKAIEMAIGVGHQFVGLLGCGVKTDRMIGAVGDRERQP